MRLNYFKINQDTYSSVGQQCKANGQHFIIATVSDVRA